MTRIDFRVIPFLCIMYLLAFLDRYVLHCQLQSQSQSDQVPGPDHAFSCRLHVLCMLLV